MTATTSWELDREHEEFRASVRSFVDRQVRPVVEESEEAGRPPAALLKEMGSAGPARAGRRRGSTAAAPGTTPRHVVLSEELARASGGIAVTALVSGYMSTPHIAHFGTADQRARYLPGLVAGEKVASIAVTEPGTGSDVGGITTRATPCRGRRAGYRLDGTKMFITNAGIADVFVVAARTSPDGHRGHHHLHRRGRQSRAAPGPAAAQDGLARFRHPRGDPGRLRGRRPTPCSASRTAASTRSCRPSSWSGSPWPRWGVGHAAECLRAGDRLRPRPRGVRRRR